MTAANRRFGTVLFVRRCTCPWPLHTTHSHTHTHTHSSFTVCPPSHELRYIPQAHAESGYTHKYTHRYVCELSVSGVAMSYIFLPLRVRVGHSLFIIGTQLPGLHHSKRRNLISGPIYILHTAQTAPQTPAFPIPFAALGKLLSSLP